MARTLLAAVRTAIGVPLFFVFTLLLATYIIVVALFLPHHPHLDNVIGFWARRFLGVGPIKLDVSGGEGLDPAAQYVFVSNHLSNFDIPVLFGGLDHRIRFLAKKEIYKIPLVATAMRRVGIVETDRAAGSAAHATINAGIAKARSHGYSLIIFPEGTRSRDGDLHMFKKGAFRIAIANGMDVVPVALHGSWEAWPPGSKLFSPGKVRLVVHDPIPVGDLSLSDIGTLRDEAYKVIDQTWQQLRPPEG